MNFIEGRLEPAGNGPAFVAGERRLPLDGYEFGARPEAGRPVTLGVRPEHIALDGAGNWDGFTVDIVEPMGADNLIWCTDGALSLEVRMSGERAIRPGSPLVLACPRSCASTRSSASLLFRTARAAAARALITARRSNLRMSVADVLSIQLYTMRSLDDLDRILDAVAEAGYRHVETVGSHLDDAATTRAKLDARGLKASSSHVSLAALRERPDAVIEACRTLGVDQLFMPAVPPEQRDMAADGWRALGRELGQMAERLRGARDRARLSQPSLGAEAQGGRQDRARADLRGGGGQPAHLAGGRGLAGARRRRAEGVAEPLSQPADLGARQGHRAGRAERGRGRLGRRRRRRARLARSVAGLP